MANYSGTKEEQLEKRRAYDKKRWADPGVRERARLRRQTPEYKAMAAAASKRYRSTPEYRLKKAAYRAMPKHKDKRRDTLLRQQFGITLDDYNVMLEAQGGVCAICGNIDPVRSLAVDHCHETGKVRGLLCRDCNQGLGLYRDNITRLHKAAEYLRVHCDDCNEEAA